jgi:uncharacterized membrane protein YuzA (DUF378 family)
MRSSLLILLTVVSLVVAPAGVLANAVASACPASDSSQGQVLSGIQETGSNCSDKQLTDTITTVVQILSLIVGIAAVIAIISGGFKYINSGGDAGKVKDAKNTIIYALVGVAIAALAQLLVHFVLNRVSNG